MFKRSMKGGRTKALHKQKKGLIKEAGKLVHHSSLEMLGFKEKSSFGEHIGKLDLACDRTWDPYTKLR